MKVKAIVSGFGVTEDKEYDVIFEYDTVYELKVDDGKIYYRPKGFFKVINN